jgi:hypothetical protein
METIRTIHAIFGERVLPLLIVLAAIWFVATWTPNAPPNIVARIFPVLVDIQVALGIIFWVFGIATGESARFLGFPFILHPILGIIAAGVAHLAMRPRGRIAGLGRWSPLVPLVVLLLIVVGNAYLARAS